MSSPSLGGSTPIVPIVPTGDSAHNEELDSVRDVNGVETLDHDANPDLVDSADADVLASVDPDERD